MAASGQEQGSTRTPAGIDEQVAKAAKAVAGLAPIKRNGFMALDRRRGEERQPGTCHASTSAH
jgi:hypothetical protein